MTVVSGFHSLEEEVTKVVQLVSEAVEAQLLSNRWCLVDMGRMVPESPLLGKELPAQPLVAFFSVLQSLLPKEVHPNRRYSSGATWEVAALGQELVWEEVQRKQGLSEMREVLLRGFASHYHSCPFPSIPPSSCERGE
jgi:hypothetical protein